MSFNNPDVYLEKMIVNPRHIEVQMLGDKHGNYLYLGERDCTIQRRRQKLIEEAPSPMLTTSWQENWRSSRCNCKAANYFSAGTVEFLLDEERNFYFMEVNTRIQVEHTVTEELTGIDLVKEQIRIARGEKLKIKQKDIKFEGHVIQCRINAENPAIILLHRPDFWNIISHQEDPTSGSIAPATLAIGSLLITIR